MATVAVVYHTGSGHTKLMAEAVQRGAGSVDGVEAQIHAIVEGDFHQGRWSNDALLEALDASDAILFGCPTYMGGVSAQMKAFLDATLPRWAPRTWADKLAAGFSVSSTPSGDKLNALGDLMVAALQMGMIWVGQEQIPLNDRGLNRLSFYLGAGAQAQYGGAEVAVHAEDLATGEVFGARVARVAARWVAGRDA